MSEPAPGPTEKFGSFIDAILFHAAKRPNDPAIGLETGVLTYTQLADAIHSAVARCEKAGLRFGAIVGLIVADPVWHICLIAALYRLGVVSVSLAPEEISVFADGILSAVLHDSGTSVPANGMVVEPNWFTNAEPRSGSEEPFAADELCRIALSSGTTGQPQADRAQSCRSLWHG